MALYYIAVSILSLLVFWLLTATFFASSFPPPPGLRNKRILLLIGHPDDEAMFFAPALIALASPESGNQVRIVCLSTGDADGKGEIRRGELLNSARRLGIRQDQDVHIANDQRFRDGPENDWKKADIADFLAQLLGPEAISQSNTTPFSSPTPGPTLRRGQQQNGEAISISERNQPAVMHDVFLTFDNQGISLHPNHCACYHGAKHFLDTLPTQPSSTAPPPVLYTLTSIPLSRKYISVLDAPVTVLATLFDLLTKLKITTSKASTSASARAESGDRSVVFVSGFSDYARAFGAMVFAHKTQMLWFRWGWILAGRYMVVNDLKREQVGRAS
jgi:N-acetylglucosaminylphosphatidylinositol deacetylase